MAWLGADHDAPIIANLNHWRLANDWPTMMPSHRPVTAWSRAARWIRVAAVLVKCIVAAVLVKSIVTRGPARMVPQWTRRIASASRWSLRGESPRSSLGESTKQDNAAEDLRLLPPPRGPAALRRRGSNHDADWDSPGIGGESVARAARSARRRILRDNQHQTSLIQESTLPCTGSPEINP